MFSELKFSVNAKGHDHDINPHVRPINSFRDKTEKRFAS